jgi:hypothetical protein
LGDLGVDGKIILKIYLREVGCEDVNWFNGLRVRSIERLLWIRIWTFGFHKRRSILLLLFLKSTSEYTDSIRKDSYTWDSRGWLASVVWTQSRLTIGSQTPSSVSRLSMDKQEGSMQTYNAHIRKKIIDVLSKMRSLRINLWPITKCFRVGNRMRNRYVSCLFPFFPHDRRQELQTTFCEIPADLGPFHFILVLIIAQMACLKHWRK